MSGELTQSDRLIAAARQRFQKFGFRRTGIAEIARDAGVADQWNRARATGEESYVPLPRPIPVRLLYQTAFVDGGRVVIAPDAYGWDEDVAEALGLPARPRRAATRRVRDSGP